MIISIYGINQMVLIMEIEHVVHDRETKFLSIIQLNASLERVKCSQHVRYQTQYTTPQK
jgi:hypothetical protein